MIEIRIFGETRVVDGDRTLGPRELGGIKPRQVLEVLALHAGHPVSKDRLIERLWGADEPETATATLEAYVSVLRRRLQPRVPARDSLVRTTNGGYLLDTERAKVDLVVFRELLTAPRAAPSSQARPILRRALAIAESDLLESEPTSDWAERARAGVVADIVSACAEAGVRALDCAEWEDAIALSRRALTMDPLAEACARIQVEALWRAGRRAEALRAYEDMRQHLAEHLGVDPDRATQDLYLAVLRDLRVEDTAAVAAPSVPQPRSGATSEEELLERLWCVLVQAVRGSGRMRNDHADSLVARITADLTTA